MAIPKRSSQPGTYFVTSATAQRRRVFQIPAHAELLISTLQHYRAQGCYKLHAFVVMPDHFHALLTPQNITIERAIGLIKGGFSHRLAAPFSPWQRGFTDHRVRDKADFLTRREYIDQNPVRAKLAQHAADYPYSSAYRAPAAEAATTSETQRHG